MVQAAVAADDMRFVERLVEDWSPGYDHAADMAHVREALAPEGCLLAAITYYRHNASRIRHPGAVEQAREAMAVTTPLLYLHGAALLAGPSAASARIVHVTNANDASPAPSGLPC